MKRRLLFIISLVILNAVLFAQSVATQQPVPAKDSIARQILPAKRDPARPPKKDTARVPARPDSLVAQNLTDSTAAKTPVDYSTSTYNRVLKENPGFNFFGKAVIRTITERRIAGKEGLFYLFGGLFLLLALVKTAFGKYFQNLFAVFFRASMKQKQIREQLLQTPLASLLLNLLFVAVGGLYAAFIIHNRGGSHGINFWLLYGYCAAGLALVYLGKFFVLKVLGWTLRMTASTDTYIFIVFLCNKILGIFLLPVLLAAAFGDAGTVTVAMTVSYVLVIGIFLYRYISAYGYINREVRTSRFHFFLYLCAFEVAPLLLIYKVLLKFV
jgi:hypothetical protein